MRQGGRNTQKGIQAQNWAALSLFLQHVERRDFLYIGFETEKLQDFYLVFDDGRKVICESKASKIGFHEVKKILETCIKNNAITENDELLIICEEADKSVKNAVEYLPYYDSENAERFATERGLTQEQLRLLPQVKFLEVTQEISKKTAEMLISKLLRIWVPKHRLDEIVRDLLEKDIYEGSKKGTKLSKIDFIKKLDEKKRSIFADARYDKERVEKEKELKKLIEELIVPQSQQWSNNSLSILSNDPDEHYWVLTLLEKEENLNLKDWEELWNMSFNGPFIFECFNIFKKNIHTKENQEYIMEFIPRVLETNIDLFREDIIKTDIIRICKIILNSTREHDRPIFYLIKDLFEPSISKYFYMKHHPDTEHEWNEASQLLLELYEKAIIEDLKKEIVDYIFGKFNLVEDDGQFWHYTPPPIFGIVKRYYETNPKKGIIELAALFSKQFDAFYKQFGKKVKFDGWELMGSVIATSGSQSSINDKYFVVFILRPLLSQLWKNNRKDTWNFILENCLSYENVSKDKPDFLNRLSLPFIFDEYKVGKHNKEALEILIRFIKMRKGIPWKNDLIFQELMGDYTDEQKWKLISASLEEYKNLPTNDFVDSIVFDLAAKRNKPALQTIKNWVKNPEYFRLQLIHSSNFTENILKLVKNKNPEIFSEAVEIYLSYIQSETFTEKENDWNTWEVAKVLGTILSIDFQRGLSILQELNSTEILAPNQQTLICTSINDDAIKDNKEILNKIFSKFLSPVLQGFDNKIEKIAERFSNENNRELIVQFADKLAKVMLINEAFSIVEIFINDLDPSLEDSQNDPKGDFNEHKKVIEGKENFAIRTVRGWCAWVLQEVMVPRDFSLIKQTREIIAKSLPLIEELTKDPNYYVRVQSTAPLLHIVKNRNTVLPEDRTQRFVSLEISKKIENIAFSMLRDPINHKLPAVMEHLAMVFSYMRSVSQKEAEEILQIFLRDEYPEKLKERRHESFLADVLSQIASLYIFFAEYRNIAFKNWPKELGTLEKFDQEPFQNLLKSLIASENPEVKQIFSWHFARLPDEVKDTPEFGTSLKMAASYLKLATKVYDHRTFENIYHLVEDNIDSDYFLICFDLWKSCIETESTFFKENYTKDKLLEMYWWPFFYNGKILLKIAEKESVEEFLRWFDVLADYPNEILIANDLDNAVEHLTKIKTHKDVVQEVFKKLIKRNSKYYETKQKWLNNLDE